MSVVIETTNQMEDKMARTRQERMAELAAKIERLKQEEAMENSPELKEIDQKLTVSLKVLGDLRRDKGRKARILESVPAKIAELKAREQEAKDFMANADSRMEEAKKVYNLHATKKAEITGSHVPLADDVLKARDEAEKRGEAPEVVTE